MGCAYSSPQDEPTLKRSVPNSVPDSRLCQCPLAEGHRTPILEGGHDFFLGRDAPKARRGCCVELTSKVGGKPPGAGLGRGTAGPFGPGCAGCIFLLPKDRMWTGSQEGPVTNSVACERSGSVCKFLCKAVRWGEARGAHSGTEQQ